MRQNTFAENIHRTPRKSPFSVFKKKQISSQFPNKKLGNVGINNINNLEISSFWCAKIEIS